MKKLWITEQVALRIRIMRDRGESFQAIASELAIPYDSVRDYCRSAGIGGDAFEFQLNRDNRRAKGRACPYCGGPLMAPRNARKSPYGRKKRFCSDICRKSYWKIHNPEGKTNSKAMYERTCPYCGQVFFVYGDARRKYCCRDHYFLDRFGERREPDGKKRTKAQADSHQDAGRQSGQA